MDLEEVWLMRKKPYEGKQMSMRIDYDFLPWLRYAASVDGVSMSEYLNSLLRKDYQERASDSKGYQAWLSERNA